MPPKYRKMADFHEYYSGARIAPYLTLFIGGNHEASNHLFELYYGGWVAPNIYYMGAANILRLGPLRIAGLSGIWKGYDYRKPHFERLPYNETELVSIFHVRELDVRKMLSVRTQVDIGLSHDWPQGVEWKGDHAELFRRKDRFEGDSNQGRLGSVAARQCLDRLRPSYWFSAHLHIKYAAIVQHGEHEPVRAAREPWLPQRSLLSNPKITPEQPKNQDENRGKIMNLDSHFSHHQQPSGTIKRPGDDNSSALRSLATPITSKTPSPHTTPEQAHVSAWQNFHVDASKTEVVETERHMRQQRERAAEEERTGIRSSPRYTFDETWKQVNLDENDGRQVAAVSKKTRPPGQDTTISNMDGCTESKLKRRRSQSPEGQTTPPPKVRNGISGQLDGQVPPPATGGRAGVKNADEIELNLSDSSSEEAEAAKCPSAAISKQPVPTSDRIDSTAQASQNSHPRGKLDTPMSDDSDEGGVKLDPTTPAFVPMANIESLKNLTQQKSGDEESSKSDPVEVDEPRVSDEMRAQLAELSSNFGAPSTRPEICEHLPLPEKIVNKTTQFLALDKCERSRDFLQLLEMEAISEQTSFSSTRPYKLQYDREWLSILRVFAPELELGGNPNAAVPRHRGDTFYHDRIIEEEKWIEEHVVKPGKLTVPENFTLTAPTFDPNEEVMASVMPREYTNPQTTAFCELIGIENKFDMSEEERDSRMAQGPSPSESTSSRGGGRGGFNPNRGRGGRSRGRGGRGRGRSWA
jgi:lariat debranching enzyme